MALSSLRPRYHALVFTVDASQCLEYHPEATQLLAVLCKYSSTLQVLRRESWSSISKYYESQTTALGSSTSLVPPLPRQSEVQTERRNGEERDCCSLGTPGTSTTRLVVGVISTWRRKGLLPEDCCSGLWCYAS